MTHQCIAVSTQASLPSFLNQSGHVARRRRFVRSLILGRKFRVTKEIIFCNEGIRSVTKLYAQAGFPNSFCAFCEQPTNMAAQFSGPIAQGSDEGGNLDDTEDISEKMAGLQKMRVALVILTSQETSKLLSRRQRVAGKEIEVMCAERDLHDGGDVDANRLRLDELYREDAVLRQVLRESEQEIERMEDLMTKINADIAALCQA
jgi:hypothetical protein